MAKEHVAELRGDSEDEEDEGLFLWIDEDDYEGHSYSKVWVEERPIEDASTEFHK